MLPLKGQCIPSISALYTLAMFNSFYFNYFHFHNISASSFVTDKLKSLKTSLQFALLGCFAYQFFNYLKQSHIIKAAEMPFNFGRQGKQFLHVIYKLNLPPRHLHKNTHLFVRKLWGLIAFNSSPTSMCYVFPSFVPIFLQCDSQFVFKKWNLVCLDL